MSLKFTHVATLLESLETNRLNKALTHNRALGPNRDHRIVEEWFSKHNHLLPRQGPEALAFLSCLLPERVPQRSYFVKEDRLVKLIARAHGLVTNRYRLLEEWQKGGLDFGQTVQNIVKQCEADPPSPARVVTAGEVDAALLQLAANSPFSANKIRDGRDDRDRYRILLPVMRRMQSWELKWLVRMVLKDFGPVVVPEHAIFREFHFLLADVLAAQNDLEAALTLLSHQSVRHLPYKPGPVDAKALKATVRELFVPRMGIMISRQQFDKARSLKHCINMSNERRMSVERKYDGEFCQIHITRTAERDHIQIFSKSGKDSTTDRIRLHGAIEAALNLKGVSKVQYRCIIEGELLVWSRAKQKIEPFHKIRKHVLHGRRFLGTKDDSPPRLDEQLMIVFYDLLLLDDKLLFRERHETRRQHLKGIITVVPGQSEIADRQIIDFGDNKNRVHQLRERFAWCLKQRWEGLVLKGCDDPCLSWSKPSRTIKLKQDYLRQLGDSADLCIVGARREARLSLPEDMFWNVFYLACLENKESLTSPGMLPHFNIIGHVTTDTRCVSPNDLEELNREGKFRLTQPASTIVSSHAEMLIPGPRPAVMFKKPFVVEILGSGYDKNSGCSFWTLRFPRLTKIHYDRTEADTMSFSELQQAAITAQQTAIEGSDDDETQQWLQKLVQTEGCHQLSQSTGSQRSVRGAAPRSETTASISPVAARKRALAPVFVRADTAELTEEDLRARRAGSQITSTDSSRTPSTAKSALSLDHPLAVQERRRTVALLAAGARQSLPSPPQSSQIFSPRGMTEKRPANTAAATSPTKVWRTLVKSPSPKPVHIDLTHPSPPMPCARPAPRRAGLSAGHVQKSSRNCRNPRGLRRTPPWCRSESSHPAIKVSECQAPGCDVAQVASPGIDDGVAVIDYGQDRASQSRAAREPLGDIGSSDSQHNAVTGGFQPRDPFETTREAKLSGRRTGEETSARCPEQLTQPDITTKVYDPRVFSDETSVGVAKPITADMQNVESATAMIWLPSTNEGNKGRAIATEALQPSPPTGLAAIRQGNAAQHASRESRKDTTKPTERSLQSKTNLPGSALLSQSLLALPPEESAALMKLLASASTSFTFSCEAFLEGVVKNLPGEQRRLVLTRTSDHRVVAGEISTLGRGAVCAVSGARESLRDCSMLSQWKVDIMICDWKSLLRIEEETKRLDESVQSESGQAAKEPGLEEHLICTLHLGNGIVDAAGRLAAKVKWSDPV
jgi:DNA ligase 4